MKGRSRDFSHLLKEVTRRWQVRKVHVAVRAADPLSSAGLAECLDACSEVIVLPADRQEDAEVMVVAVDRFCRLVVSILRKAVAESRVPVVLVADEPLDEKELLTAVECRVVAVLPRDMASPERLAQAIRAASSGGGLLPSSLVGELLKHVERLQREVLGPNGLNASGLTPREVDVLRMMAEGFDTAEIASTLCYSERTVKNVIHGLSRRFKLRSRAHAVAYAVRTGTI